MSALRVVVAPSGFKESLSAEDVAACIATGVRAACPGAETVELPLVDGGEGFAGTLVNVTGGTLHPARVTAPVGEPVEASFGILGGEGPRTGVSASASSSSTTRMRCGSRRPWRWRSASTRASSSSSSSS